MPQFRLTLWQCVCAAAVLEPEIQQRLQLCIVTTNPRQLQRDSYTARDNLFDLPEAAPTQTKHVLETLTDVSGP